MGRRRLTATAGVALLWAGTALATLTPQQLCDSDRAMAWGKYVSCVNAVVAKDAAGVIIYPVDYAAFARCRHAYFNKWKVFRANAALATSTCKGARVTDNGDGTVTDHLTELVWEKKTLDRTAHDVGNGYTWSKGTNREDGTAFTIFLAGRAPFCTNCPPIGLNTAGFAGASGWRLPTLAELQTILLDFPCTPTSGCTCRPFPCIDSIFGPPSDEWSATGDVSDPGSAWRVGFSGIIDLWPKTLSFGVRAVRGGL